MSILVRPVLRERKVFITWKKNSIQKIWNLLWKKPPWFYFNFWIILLMLVIFIKFLGHLYDLLQSNCFCKVNLGKFCVGEIILNLDLFTGMLFSGTRVPMCPLFVPIVMTVNNPFLFHIPLEICCAQFVKLPIVSIA